MVKASGNGHFRPSKIWAIGLIVIVLIIVAIAIFFVMRQDTNLPRQGTSSSSPVLMQLTSRGGMCEKGACTYDTQNIHLDGAYDGHASLSKADAARLRELIAKLNNTSHKGEKTFCQSYADGIDSIWIFPEYGQVVPCEIENSANESIIKDIEGIVYRQ